MFYNFVTFIVNNQLFYVQIKPYFVKYTFSLIAQSHVFKLFILNLIPI
jgi:hypothetical protein